MGTKRNFFVTITVAGLSALTALTSSQLGASPLLGLKPAAIAPSSSKLSSFPSNTGSTTSLPKMTAGSSWTLNRSVGIGMGETRAGSSQADWTFVPPSPRPSERPGVNTLSLGAVSSGIAAFNRDMAVVVMDTDDGWRTSNNIFGSQFRSQLTDQSTFRTDWTGSRDTDSNNEWSPTYRPQSNYRTVSEFCSTDISKESGSSTDCRNYSGPILSILRVMDGFIGWIKSFWGDGGRSA